MNRLDGMGAYLKNLTGMQRKNDKKAYDGSEMAKNGDEKSVINSAVESYSPSKEGLEAMKEKGMTVKNNNQSSSTDAKKLSDAAQSLLDELKEKYKNMDFIIADYSSEEEAQKLLESGEKEYSVLIDPDTLEKMAADEKTKEKYLGILEDSTNKLDSIKEELEDVDGQVASIGFSIDGDGNVTYFAKLLEESESRSKQIEEDVEAKRQAKREEKAEAKKKEREEGVDKSKGQPPKVKTLDIKANSVEELLEKIKNVNWSEVETDEKAAKTTGSIDVSL